MGLLDEVTQWLGENIVEPVKKGAGKYSDFMGDMEQYLKDKGDETINGMIPQDAGDQEINPMMAGTMSPLDFVNKGSGINPQMTAAQQAATGAAEMVLPGKKAGLVGRIVKGGLKAAGLIGTGYALKKGASKAEETDIPLATNHGNIEYTPKQAEEAWTKKVDEEKARTAETSAPKEEPFDINAIADKYGAEVSPSGGLISEKDIKNAGKEGLVKRGYIEKGGKKIFIYGAKPQAETEAGADKTGQAPTREGFYKFAIVQVKKSLGIDPDTFNPVTEAKKALDADQEYQYMKKRLTEGNFTPQKRAQIQGMVNDREQQVTRELAYKGMLAKDAVKRMVDMFDKQKDKFGVAAAGSTIYDKETGKPTSTIPGKETGLAAANMTAIEKATERMFMDKADPSMVQMGGKVYESLSPGDRTSYDQINEQAQRIMLDASNKGKVVTPQEAVRMAKEGSKGKPAPEPKSRAEATAQIKQAYPNATDDKINAYLAKKFPNLK